MKIALIQMDITPERTKKNLGKIVSFSKKAAKKGAKIILFPETALTDCVSDVNKVAQEVPSGPACNKIKKLAEKLGVYISFGLIEKDGIHRYITQVFLGPNNFNYKYRKTWLYATNDRIKKDRRYRDDTEFFDPGQGPEIFKIEGIKSSCIICADTFSERCFKIMNHLKPKIIFYPNNREIRRSKEYWGNIARKFNAHLLITNRVGNSWGEKCEGGCFVFSKEGKLLAETNKESKEELLLFDLKN